MIHLCNRYSLCMAPCMPVYGVPCDKAYTYIPMVQWSHVQKENAGWTHNHLALLNGWHVLMDKSADCYTNEGGLLDKHEKQNVLGAYNGTWAGCAQSLTGGGVRKVTPLTLSPRISIFAIYHFRLLVRSFLSLLPSFLSVQAPFSF